MNFVVMGYLMSRVNSEREKKNEKEKKEERREAGEREREKKEKGKNIFLTKEEREI